MLSGVAAALFVVGRTVRPLKSIARAIRALAGGEKHTSIPATDVENEIGDIARAAEVFRRSLVDADTAREAAIHALAEQRLAEESYRKLFEGSVDGIYVTTPAGALLNANPALARILGYETPEELIKAVSDIAHTIYVDPSARALYQSMMQRDGTVREFEYQVRQRTGSILWLSDSATVVRDEAGEVIRYEGTVRDITDQKRAEDAIAEGRRLLAAGDRHRTRGDQRQGQGPALCPDEPLHGGHFRHRSRGCDRPHHLRPDVALRLAKDRRKRQAGVGDPQRAWASTKRNTWIPPAMCGNGW